MEIQFSNDFCLIEQMSDDQLPPDQPDVALSVSATTKPPPTSTMTLHPNQAAPASVDPPAEPESKVPSLNPALGK